MYVLLSLNAALFTTSIFKSVLFLYEFHRPDAKQTLYPEWMSIPIGCLAFTSWAIDP